MRWFVSTFFAVFFFWPIVTMANGGIHIYVSDGLFAETDYVVDFSGDDSGTFTISGYDLGGSYVYGTADSLSTLVLNYTSEGSEGDQDFMKLAFTSRDAGTFTGSQRVAGLLHLDFRGTFEGFQGSGLNSCCGVPPGSLRTDLRPYAVQFGEAQRKPEGVQVLYRLATEVFVTLVSESDRTDVLADLIDRGKPLQGFTVDFDFGMGFILVTPASLAPDLMECPAIGQTLIESARQVPGVRIANPVFLNLDSNLRFMPRDDYIVHLKTGMDVQAIVPSGRLIQPLDPLNNEFVVQASGISWEELIREVNVLTLDQRVDWVEPNYEFEAIGLESGPSTQSVTNLIATSNNIGCYPEQARLSLSTHSETQTLELTVSEVHNRIVTIQKSTPAGWTEVTNSIGGERVIFTLPLEKNSALTLFRALAY